MNTSIHALTAIAGELLANASADLQAAEAQKHYDCESSSASLIACAAAEADLTFKTVYKEALQEELTTVLEKKANAIEVVAEELEYRTETAGEDEPGGTCFIADLEILKFDVEFFGEGAKGQFGGKVGATTGSMKGGLLA